MNGLKVTFIVALTVILAVAALGAGAAERGKTPEVEMGVFVDYGIGPHSPPPWDDSEDDYRINQGITWPTTPVAYYDASNTLRYTTWPVQYKVYTTDASRFNEVGGAFETWDSQVTSNIFATPTQVTSSPPPPTLDGENTVSWQNLGSGGPVGATYYRFYPRTKTLLEFDVVFNSALPWSTARPVPTDAEGNPTHYDVASVATHEAGHTLVLFDLYGLKDYWLTMYGYTWKGDDLKDTLGYGDTLGIQRLYP